MTLKGDTPVYFPADCGGKPVCDSKDVMATFGLESVASDFLRLAVRDRRQLLCSGRDGDLAKERRFLYKYQSLDFSEESSVRKARSILVHNRIWAAHPKTLNDPNELRFIPILNERREVRMRWTKDNMAALAHLPPAKKLVRKREIERMSLTPEFVRNIQESVLENTGVFSACTSPRQKLLWAHYANSHKGICVQLAPFEDPLFLVAKPVVYDNQFPTLTIPSTPGKEEEHYLRKSEEWNYEKEWRLILPLNDCAVCLRPQAISGVILGAKSTKETEDKLFELLEERQRLGRPPIRVYRAKLDSKSYKMQIAKHS